jgi:Tfp pilus assembly protein PilV
MPKAFRPQRRDPQAGFSLIEAMIAALLLLIVILGVIPLVSRGMLNNLQGNDASNEANASMDGIERLLSLPFDNIDLELTAGQTTLVSQDVFTLKGNSWRDLAAFTADPQGDSAQFLRIATIQQFNASDIDLDGTLDTPLDGGAGPGFVHLKRITMDIRNGRHLFTAENSYRVIAVQSY